MEARQSIVDSISYIHRQPATASTGPTLNMDVLVDIMRFTAPKHSAKTTFLNMMKTCRTLYSAGLPFLLAHVDILLPDRSTLDNLASFCGFVELDKSHRCQFIQSILISLRGINEGPRTQLSQAQIKTLERFSAILGCCHNLRSLTLPDSEAWLYYGSRCIPEALSTLACLRKLQLVFTFDASHFENTARLLSMLRVPLRKVALFRQGESGQDVIGDPLAMLLNHRTTLECVHFGPCKLEPTTLLYPKLRTLALGCARIDQHHNDIVMSQIMRSLPNLERLALGKYPSPVSPAARERFRQNNGRIQRERCMWPRLDILSGHVAILYGWGITCPVRCLQITDYIHQPGDFYTTVLTDCTPSALCIQIKLGRWGLTVHDLRTLIPAECAQSVTQLSVRFTFPDDAFDEPDNLLENIYVLLDGLPLTFLNLHLCSWEEVRPSRDAGLIMPSYDWPALVYIQGLNPDILAFRIAECVPSLQYLTLRRGTGKNRGSMPVDTNYDVSWRIYKAGDRICLEKQPCLYSLEEFGMEDISLSYDRYYG
ncbi:hypothetical protein K474DRAFT_1670071 [Panus rudis PR-1116 ss-1]|nr:hypothetical protein K474DRAFT_1670071 [Panus rudis PR-1116 ss-1]